jgi:hypothetical protein
MGVVHVELLDFKGFTLVRANEVVTATGTCQRDVCPA